MISSRNSWPVSQSFSGLPSKIFCEFPFRISAAIDDISHGVFPMVSCKAFPRLFLVVVYRISCSDPPEIFFSDFPGITPKVLSGIPTGNCFMIMGFTKY